MTTAPTTEITRDAAISTYEAYFNNFAKLYDDGKLTLNDADVIKELKRIQDNDVTVEEEQAFFKMVNDKEKAALNEFFKQTGQSFTGTKTPEEATAYWVKNTLNKDIPAKAPAPGADTAQDVTQKAVETFTAMTTAVLGHYDSQDLGIDLSKFVAREQLQKALDGLKDGSDVDGQKARLVLDKMQSKIVQTYGIDKDKAANVLSKIYPDGYGADNVNSDWAVQWRSTGTTLKAAVAQSVPKGIQAGVETVTNAVSGAPMWVNVAAAAMGWAALDEKKEPGIKGFAGYLLTEGAELGIIYGLYAFFGKNAANTNVPDSKDPYLTASADRVSGHAPTEGLVRNGRAADTGGKVALPS